MRTQSSNPVYRLFRNRLAPSGRYLAQDVDIFWNLDEVTGHIKDLEVVFIPRDVLRDDRVRSEYHAYHKPWNNDLGNSVSDWLKPNGINPEYIFGYLLTKGFETKIDLKCALEEFGHIEECSWARGMLEGWRYE